MRERRRDGLRVLPVEVSLDTVETLIELDMLDPEDARDLDAVADALARFIEDTTERVTRNAITLDAW